MTYIVCTCTYFYHIFQRGAVFKEAFLEHLRQQENCEAEAHEFHARPIELADEPVCCARSILLIYITILFLGRIVALLCSMLKSTRQRSWHSCIQWRNFVLVVKQPRSLPYFEHNPCQCMSRYMYIFMHTMCSKTFEYFQHF